MMTSYMPSWCHDTSGQGQRAWALGHGRAVRPAAFNPGLRTGSARRHAARHGRTRVDLHAGRHRLPDVQRPGQPARRARSEGAELVDGHGPEARRQGAVDAERDAEPRSRDRRQPGLQPHLPGRRVVRRESADRSSASARFPDAGRRRLAAAADERRLAHARRRAWSASRRSARSPSCTDRRRPRTRCRRSATTRSTPSHIAMGVLDRVARSRPVPGRVVDLQRRASPTRTAGISWTPAPLDSWSIRGWYRPSPDVDLPGVPRIPRRSRRRSRKATSGGRRRRDRG